MRIVTNEKAELVVRAVRFWPGSRRRRSPQAEAEAESTAETPFFFVHVMKTAGTTFVLQLQQLFGMEHVYPLGLDAHRNGDVRPYSRVEVLLGLSAEERAKIRVYAGHFPFVAYEQLGVPATTMTILREPVARTVSMLKHCKREMDVYRDLELEEIYERPLVRLGFVDNFQTKQFAFTRADAPESCLDPLEIDEDRLRLAVANLDSVDVVGTTERYAEFLEELRRRFGWDIAELGNRNVSREQWDVSPEFRDRIAHDNRFDVAFYEHAQARGAR